MNKLALSMIGAAAFFVFSMEAQARGASTHISAGPSPSAAHASGAQGAGAGAASAPGMPSNGAKSLSQLLSPTSGMTGNFSGIATSSASAMNASTMNGSTTNGSLSRQLLARGIVPGVGNSLGSMNSGSVQTLGNGNGRITAMTRQLSQSGGPRGGKTTGAITTGKPQGPMVLGVTRAAKTGEVCIWGAGSDGSCH